MFNVRQGPLSVAIEPAEHEESVLAAIAGNPELTIFAPCGGSGRCGKCAVTIPGDAPAPSAADRRFLGETQIAAGVRLACTCPADAVREVVIPVRERGAFVKGAIPQFDAAPAVWEVARDAAPLAVAVDIGTTTVAAYLVDTATGEARSVVSEINRQSVYGADVLSRISYSEQAPAHLGRLAAVVRAQLAEMIHALGDLSAAHDAGRQAIGTAVIVANTTMLHLLAGVSPSGIGRAPFVPEFVEHQIYAATDLDLPISGDVHLIPSIAAYVGADIVSAAVAADMDRDPRTTLLVDIGTNGEIALSHDGAIYTCSTAAGPAFEGASISAGVGGIAGAISSWHRHEAHFAVETIDDAPVVGICGSGLLDLVANLLNDGVVDETGRMLGAEEVAELQDEETRNSWLERIIEDDSGPAVTIAEGYRFTQKDVREVQLAKASIAAGVDVLCAEAGITVGDIERLVLTGGFGNHLRIDSAVRIGLLPRLPWDRYVSIDNAAGRGAVMVLRDAGTLERMVALAAEARYIELSGHELFQEQYIERMIFPEEVYG